MDGWIDHRRRGRDVERKGRGGEDGAVGGQVAEGRLELPHLGAAGVREGAEVDWSYIAAICSSSHV